MNKPQVEFRCYAELNDFLPPQRRQTPFLYRFDGAPAVKDAIEAIGIPHTEVDLILVNGEAVDFGHHLRDGERVSVYPVFESLDITPIIRLREQPLRVTRFVLDGHLGKLARRLRMLGFDALHRAGFEDREIVAISVEQRRIILTRDRALLKHGAVTHGYWLRSADPDEQAVEVLTRFDLFSRTAPFSRCLACNGRIEGVEKREIAHLLPLRTRRQHDEFHRCADCGKVYWKGSHYREMTALVEWLRRGGRN